MVILIRYVPCVVISSIFRMLDKRKKDRLQAVSPTASDIVAGYIVLIHHLFPSQASS